ILKPLYFVCCLFTRCSETHCLFRGTGELLHLGFKSIELEVTLQGVNSSRHQFDVTVVTDIDLLEGGPLEILYVALDLQGRCVNDIEEVSLEVLDVVESV